MTYRLDEVVEQREAQRERAEKAEARVAELTDHTTKPLSAAEERLVAEVTSLRARVAELTEALGDLRGAAETLSVRVWDLGMIAAIERANRVIGTREVSPTSSTATGEKR